MTIPVEANEDGATLTFTLSGGSATVEVNGEQYSNVGKTVTIPLDAFEEDSECVVTFASILTSHL